MKEILFDVIEKIDEAIDYESEKKEEEENNKILIHIYHLHNNLFLRNKRNKSIN
jgi:hypothetical protein